MELLLFLRKRTAVGVSRLMTIETPRVMAAQHDCGKVERVGFW